MPMLNVFLVITIWDYSVRKKMKRKLLSGIKKQPSKAMLMVNMYLVISIMTEQAQKKT